MLKRFLRNRLAHLDQLHLAIQRNWRRIVEKHATNIVRQKTQRLHNPPLYKIDLFEDLHGQVSFDGLKKLYRQYQLAKERWEQKPYPKALPRCQDNFTKQMGLPCWHTIFRLREQGLKLEMNNIDLHWWIRRFDPFTDEECRRRREQDPRVIAPRQFNKNGVQAAEDEVIPATQRQDNSTRCEPRHDASPKQQQKRRQPLADVPALQNSGKRQRRGKKQLGPGQSVWSLN